MKKAFILVLTNFFILTLILLCKPVKAQTTEITGQFLYGLQLYVLPEKQTNPDYSTAIYSSTIDENDFITSGLYQNWLQPRLPDGINGYIYLVDSSHTIGNVYLGGGYLEQGQTLSYPYEPTIELKHYGAQLIDIFVLNPVNKYYYEAYGGRLDYIVYYEINDGSTPRIKLIDATTNENDYNRVRLTINGYDTGYNAGYSIGYNNGQNNGYNTGYEDGQNNGYNAGYNAGQYDFYTEYYDEIYNRGYKAGLGDRQIGVNTVLNFNQLARNGNFESTSNWNHENVTSTSASNNVLTITTLNNISQGNSYLTRVFQLCFSTNRVGHKILIKFDVFTDLATSFIYGTIRPNGQGITDYNFTTQAGVWTKLTNIITLTNPSADTLNLGFQLYANITTTTGYNYKVRNVNLIDLTQIYGQGNEPTTYQEFLSDFPSDYYPYTDSELINIDYENGYITGKNDGFSIGYDDGKSYQATQQLTSDGWINNIFTGIGSFLAIEILPGVSIGLIVGIPFIITVAWFVLKMARGGSSE